MKTKVSGSGVKAANRFQVLRGVFSNKFWSAYEIKDLKSKDLSVIWNYREEGLNLIQAKEQLISAFEKRQGIHKSKPRPASQKMAGYYSKLLSDKQESIKLFLSRVEKMEPIHRAMFWSYGSYKYSQRSFVIPGLKRSHPVVATIKWDESHDWDYYAKNYGRPKSTYSNRRVEFSTIGKLGKEEIVFTYKLKSFAGNFVEKALATFLKVRKVKVAKELKSLQLADYFKLVELKKINGYRVFLRKIGPVEWDYAILDTKTGTTYHTCKKENLVAGLRKKLQAKIEHETEEITKDTGYRLGFCETGMKQFCSDNNVNFEGVYTRQELRNIVIANRNVNCKKYKTELSKIGITLNCK